jgi:large subunit ribosomal protein L9
MKVILLKDVQKIGRKFDIKEVSSGYAQNLLIPKGLAVIATPQAIKNSEIERMKIEGERKVMENLIAKNIKDLNDVTIEIHGKANEKGHLFAGIHKPELVSEIKKQTELDLDPEFIDLDQPIKQLGEYTIAVKKGNHSAKMKVIVK